MCSHSNKRFIGISLVSDDPKTIRHFWCVDCGAFYTCAFWSPNKQHEWALPYNHRLETALIGAIVSAEGKANRIKQPSSQQQFCQIGDTHGPMPEPDFWAGFYYPCDGVSLHDMLNMYYDEDAGIQYHWCRLCGSLLSFREAQIYDGDSIHLVHSGYTMENPIMKPKPMMYFRNS